MRRLLLLCLTFAPQTCATLVEAQTLDSTRAFRSEHTDSLKFFYSRTVTVTRTDTVKTLRVDTLYLPPPPPAPPETTVTPIPVPVPVATKLLTGPQTKIFDSRSSPLPAGSWVDASGASWTGVGAYVVNYAAGVGSRWLGGTITGTWNPTTTVWDTYHSTFGLYAYGPRLTIERLKITNFGDGARFNKATDWTLKDAWFTDIHDDCVENDMLVSGVIDGLLCDGAYVGISVRPGSSDLATVDGSKDSLIIRNSLIRVRAQVKTATTDNTSGGFIKAENREPAKNIKLIYENNVFRADALPGTGSLCLDQHAMTRRASGNVLVWLGSGSYPCTVPPGWTMTRDVKVWDAAVVKWKARHG